MDVIPGVLNNDGRGVDTVEVRQRIEQRIELNEKENEVLEDIRGI